MKPRPQGSIISNAEAQQILRNNLRRKALEKQEAELKDATAEQRTAIMARIDAEVEKELRQHGGKHWLGNILH